MIQKILVPELGEGIASAKVTACLVQVGDIIKKEDPLIEVESDKASIEIPSPLDGIVKEVLVKNGDEIKIHQKIFNIESEAMKAESKEITPKEEISTLSNSEQSHAIEISEPSSIGLSLEERECISVPATPSVHRLARELGADINKIIGSGPKGRISKLDVKNYVKSVLNSKSKLEGVIAASSEPKMPDFASFGPIRREKFSGIRLKISERMKYSWQSIPHVTQFDEAEISALEKFRKKRNNELKGENIKLSLTSIAIKIISLALKKFPQFNTSLDPIQNEIIYKDYIHIGVAVDTEHGLFVPVLRDVDKKDLGEIAQELNNLAQKARENKIRPNELQGACFTITNLGAMGTSYFTPIINWPDIAILGLGRAKEEVFLSNGLLKTRLMLPLSLSYDHRVIDGAKAAHFSRWIAENLEYPLSF